MKKLLFAGCFMIVISSCTYHVHHKRATLPPGQAKKMTGNQSAKPFAPGQQKKHY